MDIKKVGVKFPERTGESEVDRVPLRDLRETDGERERIETLNSSDKLYFLIG